MTRKVLVLPSQEDAHRRVGHRPGRRGGPRLPHDREEGRTQDARLLGPAVQVPGLLIPIYSPTGEIVNYQFRPDQPRIGKDGKAIKYETPAGTRMVLDVHPFAREMLGDPTVPLFITEGIKKGDALVSRKPVRRCAARGLELARAQR